MTDLEQTSSPASRSHPETIVAGGQEAPGQQRRPFGKTLLTLSIVGLAAVSALLVWHPEPAGPDGSFSYDQVAADPGTWWALHTGGAIGVIVASLAVALLLVGLVQGRGRRLAALAAAMQLTGGTLFALGLAGEGSLFSYLAATELLPADLAAPMLPAIQGSASPQYLGPLFAIGGMLQAVATVPMAIALLRSRLVAGWIGWTVAGSFLITVAQQLELLGDYGFVGFLFSLPFDLAVLGIAWTYLRVGPGSR